MAHKDPRTVFTETMLKNACLQLLKNKPISKITINELCSIAGVNRSTFYRYYLDIYDLCKKIEDDFYTEFTVKVNSSNDTTATTLLYNILSAIKENPSFQISMIHGISTESFTEGILEYYKPIFIDFLQKEHPDVPENELEYIFVALSGSVSQIIFKWIKDGMQETPEKICAIMKKIYFMGIFN